MKLTKLPSHRAIRALLASMLIAIPGLMATALAADADRLSIQLNKLEPEADTCRAYIVLENGGGITFEALRLDLVLFDTNGVIARRLAVDAAPLPAGKTSVRVFGIPNLACSDIGRVLLNDVLACQDTSGERTDCMQHITPQSIAGVPFIK